MNKKIQFLSTLLVFFFGLSALPLKAQTWTVGVPVNQLVVTDFLFKSSFQLPGCIPDAAVTYNFSLPVVSGMQYYLKVTSIDANSAYKMPALDTLAVGDSIAVNAGSNTMSIYYFGSTANTDFKADLYAAGIPTTVGQSYPCNIAMLPWMSNLMICNEGLSATVSGNCQVIAGPTSMNSLSSQSYTLGQPTAQNAYTLTLEASHLQGKMMLLNATGQGVRTLSVNSQSMTMNCSDLATGLYFLVFEQEGKWLKEKIIISK